jgi:hypothetical protein
MNQRDINSYKIYYLREAKRIMKTKIIGIFICILMITTVVPTVGSLKKNEAYTSFPNTNPASGREDWNQIQELLASDGTTDSRFGCSVSIDGNTTLIGAIFDDDNGDNSGSAYVFTRTGTTWTQQAKLLASDGETADMFGCSVSIDGNTALIGASGDDDNEVNSGSAYVFTRTGTTWTQQQKLLTFDGATFDDFGLSVSLDGDTALIGAPGYGPGSAYIFTHTGTTWTQQAKLLASDGSASGGFGFSVSLSGDTALIGANVHNGSAYVFNRTGKDRKSVV